MLEYGADKSKALIPPPLDASEQMKMREQFRDFEGEKYLLAWKIYAEQSHAHRMNALINVKEYGLQLLKHLTILNGGAILALLSFVGALIAKSDEKTLLVAISFAHHIKYSLLCFTFGLIASDAMAALIYRNWLAVAES